MVIGLWPTSLNIDDPLGMKNGPNKLQVMSNHPTYCHCTLAIFPLKGIAALCRALTHQLRERERERAPTINMSSFDWVMNERDRERERYYRSML